MTARTLSRHSQKSLHERLAFVEADLKSGFERIVKAAGPDAKRLEVPEEANFTVAVVHRANFRIAATYLRLKFVVGKPVAVVTTHIPPARLENTISCLGSACDLVEALSSGKFLDKVSATTAKLLNVKVPTATITLNEAVSGSRDLIIVGAQIGRKVSKNVNISKESDCLIVPRKGVVYSPMF
ncbi:MAG TPA: hypothetical protein VFQ91_00675 [Bryobacteraceae bacterium]|nr:hypothetical protein [Bryobacteraceae bacterium]